MDINEGHEGFDMPPNRIVLPGLARPGGYCSLKLTASTLSYVVRTGGQRMQLFLHFSKVCSSYL